MQRLRLHAGEDVEDLNQADVRRLREREREKSSQDEALSGVSPRFVINALSHAMIAAGRNSLSTMLARLARVDTRFIAHTTRAWSFSEGDFFQVHGMGGTMASSAFRLCRQLLAERHGAARDNAYLFYASDGENFSEDRNAASVALGELASELNYMGYVETATGMPRALETETHALCAQQARRGLPLHTSTLSQPDDVWPVLRSFFQHEQAVQRLAA